MTLLYQNQFVTSPPSCASINTAACKDKALSSTLPLQDGSGSLNSSGDLEYDLMRNADYNSGSATAVETLFGTASAPTPVRANMAWQWAATAGTSAAMIGLDPTNNQYPTYDIDGRLKEVTIYGISYDQTFGDTTVTYEDYQGGDIDSTWDTNSCGPKPGLQNNSQILTFTKDGTYFQVREGKIYNPETGQEVRSINRRNSIDVIQRTIQLSNNTWRFCTQGSSTPPGFVQNCANGACPPTNVPNPVEICANSNDANCAASNTCTCFGANTSQTCYDTVSNIIYVRSRLEDRRGNFWMTNASGQLQVQ
jgi:hypothetical protein